MSISSAITQRVVTQQPRSDVVFHAESGDGSFTENGIHIDIANQIFYTKRPGSDAIVFSRLQDLMSTTVGNQSMYRGIDGLLKQAVTNTPRIEYQSTTIGKNYALQSENFTTTGGGGTWSSVGLNQATTAAAIAPNGTLTANKITEDTTSTQHRMRENADIAIIAGTTVQLSIYVKAAEKTFVSLRITESTFASSVDCTYNLTAGTAGSVTTIGVATGGTASITSVGDGWYRVYLRGAVNGSFTAVRCLVELLKSDGSTITYTGDGSSGLYAWGAQIEFGTTGPSSYTSTTSTVPAYRNSSPTLIGLLMEATRTNLFLQSADFNTTWTKSLCTVSVNQTTAPDGTLTADKMVSSAGTNAMTLAQPTTLAATTAYTMSCFFKYIPGEVRYVMFRSDVDTGSIVSFDLVDATTVVTQAPWANAKIESYPNGWYRCSASYTTVGTAYSMRIYLDNTGSSGSFTGDGTKGVYLWGAQMEIGQFATSYIPTTTGTVARTPDTYSRNVGTEFSSSTGTFAVTGRASAGLDVGNQFVFSVGTGTDSLLFLRPASSSIARFNIFKTGVAQGPTDSTFVNSTDYKAAMAYAANDMALSVNGGAVTTDNTVTLGTYGTLFLGSETTPTLQGNCYIRSFDYYPERRINQRLIEMSTR